jgi:hypothetical protein
MASGTAPLPGLEDQVHEDIREKALPVVNARADITAARGRDKEATAVLRETMREHGLRKYHDSERNLTVTIEESEHVVVLLGEKKVGRKRTSPVTSPGPDAPISEQTLKPLPKKQKPNAGVPRAED